MFKHHHPPRQTFSPRSAEEIGVGYVEDCGTGHSRERRNAARAQGYGGKQQETEVDTITRARAASVGVIKFYGDEDQPDPEHEYRGRKPDERKAQYGSVDPRTLG